MAYNITAEHRTATSGKYGVLHFALGSDIYRSGIPCNTPHASYSTEILAEVTCQRCRGTDAFYDARFIAPERS